MHWAVLFYHQHRLAHAPVVYAQAHKFHHKLHGSTAFDAHLYGSGLPEEFFMLWLEVGMALQFGFVPATLGYYILTLSWSNKIGHTEHASDPRGNKFHTDHHDRHVKNFGIYNAAMDMYFDTAIHNDKYRTATSSGQPVIIRKHIRDEGATVSFEFSLE
jgi:sterol desaturase/sphingolipid hydroxylase (fatty acid hydroxylase superfamily)